MRCRLRVQIDRSRRAMFAPRFWFIWTACLLMFDPVSCPEEVTVEPGEDVTLQCRGPRDSSITLFKWSRSDLKSDGGYVLFVRDDHPYDSLQLPSFRGRVELRDPEMKDGDVSIVLKNVSVNDSGTYECYIGEENTIKRINIIKLKVEGHTDKPTNRREETDGGDMDKAARNVGRRVVLPVVALVALAGVVGFLSFRNH